MKKNRYTPFGYRIENGQITLCEREADAVGLIYGEYMRGHSLKDIAEQMTYRGIPYSEAAPVWNKHMVKRILDNRKYIGDQEYPALITQDEYNSVHRTKSGKYLRKDVHTPSSVEAIKGKSICHECGQPFMRLHDRRVSPKWYCRDKNCNTDLKITDKMLLDGITAILNQIIADPNILQASSVKANTYSPETARMQNGINRELSKTAPNADHVKALLMACAAQKYAGCGDDIQYESLYNIFEGYHPLTDFDIQLFTQTIDTIQIAKNGAVYLRLKNQQTLTVPDICEKGKKHDCGKNSNSNPAKSHSDPRVAQQA